MRARLGGKRALMVKKGTLVRPVEVRRTTSRLYGGKVMRLCGGKVMSSRHRAGLQG